jgi:chromosome segregation ATPase
MTEYSKKLKLDQETADMLVKMSEEWGMPPSDVIHKLIHHARSLHKSLKEANETIQSSNGLLQQLNEHLEVANVQIIDANNALEDVSKERDKLAAELAAAKTELAWMRAFDRLSSFREILVAKIRRLVADDPV